MSLELSPEVEHAVRERAAAEGVSVNDLLARTFAPEKRDDRLPQDPKERVRALLVEWQARDNTPRLPPMPTREGETSTKALFRMWAEEDACMTEEEIKAEEQLWQDIEKGLNDHPRRLRLRELGG